MLIIQKRCSEHKDEVKTVSDCSSAGLLSEGKKRIKRDDSSADLGHSQEGTQIRWTRTSPLKTY